MYNCATLQLVIECRCDAKSLNYNSCMCTKDVICFVCQHGLIYNIAERVKIVCP